MGLKLIAELGLDGSGFASGLRKAEGLAAGAGNSLRNALVGMVGIGTVSLAITKTVESAKQLAVACERLGIGSTQLQVLRKAAKDAGVDFEKLEKTFEEVDVARRKALTPGKQGAGDRRAFSQMGITPEMLRSQTASQLFMGSLAQKAKGTNEEVFGALLKELLPGVKSIGALIPVLKTNFGELEVHMKSFGAIMDAETIVKLKHVGDEFDLIQNIIVGTLGPALVAFADWLLALAANKDSFLSKVLEGVSYKGREAMGLSKLPEGAKGAHDMAVAALGMIQTTDQRKTTPEQFRAQWKDYYTEGLGHDRNPERAGFFNGDESKTWTEELRYLNSKIQPVADVRNAAAKGAEADMKAIRDSIAEFTARMKAEAERLKNGPPPPSGGFPGDPGHRTLKSLEVPSDSLTKVGNFLGGSQGAIMRLAEQRTQYLRRIAMGIDRLSGGQRPRGSSLGNPNAVFIPLH